MKQQEIIDTINQYEARSMHGQLPVVWNSAMDDKVWDINGKEYVDFTSGICSVNVGHSNPKIMEAIEQQSYFWLLHSYNFPTEIKAQFLQFLIENTPKFIEKAFFVSSGTEATECALKLMKMYGHKNKKEVIVSFYNAMHGRTLGAEFLRGHKPWMWSLQPEIVLLPFPDKDDSFNEMLEFYRDRRGLVLSSIAGFMVETYKGWSAQFYPKKYIKELMRFAKKNKSLVCFDEIQGGMGRTGKLFNYMHYGVEPDLICVGKGFTSSLPMSGVLGRQKILDIPEEGSMSSTHSANPLCCAVALANFKEVLRLLPDVKKKGDLLHKGLEEIFPEFEINGKGLLAGIITHSKEYATKVCYRAMKKGLLLIKTDKESIKIAPPLCVTNKNIVKGLKILEECK